MNTLAGYHPQAVLPAEFHPSKQTTQTRQMRIGWADTQAQEGLPGLIEYVKSLCHSSFASTVHFLSAHPWFEPPCEAVPHRLARSSGLTQNSRSCSTGLDLDYNRNSRFEKAAISLLVHALATALDQDH